MPLVSSNSGKEIQLIDEMLKNTDDRVAANLPVTPAFVLASLLWYPLEMRIEELKIDLDISEHDALLVAMGDVLDRQTQRIMIPKRFSAQIKDIWQLQYRLARRTGRKAFVLLEHIKFRAAYDFLLVRAKVEGGELDELGQWWTDFQEVSHNQKQKMINELKGNTKPRRRKPKSRKPDQ
jgi:poly(A) polymerase